MATFNINVAGFAIADMFIVVWAVALIYWRADKVEARWTASIAAIPAESPLGGTGE